MATIQPLIFTVRGGVSHKNYGDPYQWACTVQMCGKRAFVSALAGKFSKKAFKEIVAIVSDQGATAIEYERMKKDRCELKDAISNH